MKLRKPGKNTLVAEVQNITKLGVWIFVADSEYFLPYKKFPWFKKATVAQILNLKCVTARHLRWPDLDVDLELESIKAPNKYPLVCK